MPGISYVNGSYLPHSKGAVHIEDRGFLFADGVYEVIGLINGRFADERGHLDRLERSMAELELHPPRSRKALRFIMREVVRRNRLRNAAVYIQVTRGAAKRDFKFPAHGTPSSLVVMCWPFRFDNNVNVEQGVTACSVPDQRWARRDIKSVALLPQVLARQKASELGCHEAIMVDENGSVTEGAASNFWIYKDGKLKTRQVDHNILKGVTRTAICTIAEENGIDIVEEPFDLDEAKNADETFCSSATALIVPIIKIDDAVIGNAKPGAVTRDIYARYRAYARGEYKDQIDWTY